MLQWLLKTVIRVVAAGTSLCGVGFHYASAGVWPRLAAVPF